MKKNMIRILVSVCSVLIVSGVGAICGTILNDKIQDSKIDLIAKDVAMIKYYLMGK